MATSNSSSGQRKSSTTSRAGSRRTNRPRSTAARTTGARTATRTTNRRTTSTAKAQPATRVAQAQVLAERAVLVPVGASLMARENLVAGVKGFATKYGTRASMERELKRYERRGASARNRFERQVRRTRTRFERELRQRRTSVEREVSVFRRDWGKQTGAIGTRVEKLITDAQGRLGSSS